MQVPAARRPRSTPVPRQTGVALLLALWLVTLLSIMAAGYSYAMRTETWLTIHGIDTAQARSRAEAGVWLAVADLLRPLSERRWPTDGTPAEADFGDAKVTLRIQDEAGKVDLNEAGPELLLGLLDAASTAGHDALPLRNAILDWRDPDHDRRVPGAEDDDYLSAGYDAKDGPFNSIAELRRVAGMTDEMYGNIRHAVTIHSLRPGVNPAFGAATSSWKPCPAATPPVSMTTSPIATSRVWSPSITDVDHHYFNADQGRTFTIASTAGAGRSTVTLTAVVEYGPGRKTRLIRCWRGRSRDCSMSERTLADTEQAADLNTPALKRRAVREFIAWWWEGLLLALPERWRARLRHVRRIPSRWRRRMACWCSSSMTAPNRRLLEERVHRRAGTMRDRSASTAGWQNHDNEVDLILLVPGGPATGQAPDLPHDIGEGPAGRPGP